MFGSILKDIFVTEKPPAAQAAAPGQEMEVRQKDRGSVLFFAGDSEGNALVELTKGLLAPFAPMASRVAFFDMNRPGWQEKLQEALSDPVWFAAGYFGVGQDIAATKNGESANLWESAGIPFVRFYGDIPAYFPDRHVARFTNSINAYTDSAHASFYRRWFREPALSVLHSRILFDPMPLEQVDVQSKLKGKIIFPKNGNSPWKLIDYWRMALPSSLGKTLEHVAEESIGREWIDREPCFDDRLVRHFHDLGVDIAAEPAVLCFLVAQLDDYVRRVKSTMIVEALLDLPIIIRGRFWEHVDFRGEKATYDPESDVASTLELIDLAPALVDMSPNIQHSPHDRVCRAVGRGTAFLTNKQEFLDATLQAAAERCTFVFEQEAIHNLVEHYVLHPREAVELGLEQARALRPVFEESTYVDTLLTAVQTIALRRGGRPSETQNFVAFPPALYR